MNWNKAEVLLKRYYDGLSTEQEEQELKQLLLRPDLPPHLQRDAALLKHLRRAATVETSMSDKALFARLDVELPEEKPASKSIQLSLKIFWQVAAAVALLVTGYWAGMSASGNDAIENQQTSQQSVELAQIRQEVKELKQMLSQNSPSQRIKAVSFAQQTEANAELIQALIQTMHFDENVNVRMAAIKALLHFQGQPEVRQALIHSLRIQQDPNVQLLLIDSLVEIREKEAVPQMQKLLKDTALQDAVRMRLQEGIGLLI